MAAKTQCAKCAIKACANRQKEKPLNCPMKVEAELIQRMFAEYDKPKIKEFARQATIQTIEANEKLPDGRIFRKSRIEEIVQFSKKMGYKKLGIVFCIGLINEAKTVTKILENKGFKVVSVCCKVGAIPKKFLDVQEEEFGSAVLVSMCNPITQAEILNKANTEFNIMVGLCVGHDSLFFKYTDALTTVLVVKDRAFGHNPVAGLYLTESYCSHLMEKDKS